MSLDEKGYLHKIIVERDKLRDARIPKTEVNPKPQGNKLCSSCHQSLAEPYLQPASRFVDANGIDNSGFKPNHWYWRCSNISCNYKELMPVAQEQTTRKGYRTKNTVVNNLPMHLGTIGKKRRPSTLNEFDEDDRKQLAAYLGYEPTMIEYRDANNY